MPTSPVPPAPGGPPPPPPGGYDGPATEYVPLTPGPGRRAWRPFAIGAAFALIVLAGVGAYFALRSDDTSAQPDPSGPSVLAATTTTSILPPVSTTLPPTTAVPTIAATTVPPTEAPTTEPPTTAPLVPATTGNGPPPTVAPITVAATTPAPTQPAATAAPVPTAAPTTKPKPKPTTAPTTARPTPTTVATSGNVAPSVSATVSAIRSSATRPNSVDSCGKPTKYGPINVLDGTNDSAWMTVGDGGGQYLEFTLRDGVEISTVGLVPGYAKVDACSGNDRFTDMRRIAQVTWSFDGGEELVQDLDVDSPTMQTIDLPAPVAATKVRMTIRATTDPGTAGFDFAPVSEVTLS